MKQRLEELKRKLQYWMVGRYGMDELSRVLMWAGIGFILLSFIPALRYLYILAWIVLIYTYYRCFSKNIYKRNQERMAYLEATKKFRGRINIYKKMWSEKNTHRYFRCPNCKTFVRVPKGKGKIAIRCTKCGNEMIRKS